MDITAELFKLQDRDYAVFQSKLTPGVGLERFIGVRIPRIRKLAKQIYKQKDYTPFLESLPHKYYDEDMLHGIIISEIKDYKECMEYTEAFLPYVDNWAVCDTMVPKVFKKHRAELFNRIKKWTGDKHTYTVRFGLKMLMDHFLGEDFDKGILEIPAGVRSEEYYVNMMIAWFFATALAKQWEDTVCYIMEKRLPKWVHNKTIQKAVESRRITADQKTMLKTCRI